MADTVVGFLLCAESVTSVAHVPAGRKKGHQKLSWRRVAAVPAASDRWRKLTCLWPPKADESFEK